MTDTIESSEAEHRIDITPIYPTPDAWENELERCKSEIEQLATEFEEPLSTVGELHELLRRIEAAYVSKQNLQLYVILGGESNALEPAIKEQYVAFAEGFERTISTLTKAIARRESGLLEDYANQHPEYDHYLTQLRNRGERTYTESLETAIGKLETSVRPSTIVSGVWEDYTPPAVPRPDGSTATIRPGNLRLAELAHPDRSYRRSVHEAFWGELETYRHTLAAAIRQKLRATRLRARLRDFDSVQSWAISGKYEPETGMRQSISGSLHNALITGVRNTLDPYHEMLAGRRQRLGIDDLRLWDLEVPIGDGDLPTVALSDAKEWVIAAAEPLGEDYQERTRAVLVENRIDPYPGENKSTVGYSRATAEHGPYLIENFQSDLRSAFALAHGVGHAVHASYCQDAPARYATSPRFVSEIPSVLSEILLERYLRGHHPEFSEHATDRLLNTVSSSIFQSAMTDAFWIELLERQEHSASLQPDDIDQIQLTLLREFRTPMTFSEEAGKTWMGRGTRPLFDSHSYVVGGVCALSISRRLRDGSLAGETYLNFLRETGSKPVEELLERIDCELTNDDLYSDMATEYRRIVARRDNRVP